MTVGFIPHRRIGSSPAQLSAACRSTTTSWSLTRMGEIRRDGMVGE
jgi:hypothetical protein